MCMNTRATGGADDIVSLADLVAAHHEVERQHIRVAYAAARLAAQGEWAMEGWLSAAPWLAHHLGLTRVEANRLLREGRFLHRYDVAREAVFAGTLSRAQLALLRLAVTTDTAEVFLEHQQWLVPVLAPLDVVNTGRAVNEWRERAEAVSSGAPPTVRDNEWAMSKLADGSSVGRFAFDAAITEAIERALQTAHTWDGPGDTRSAGTRQADAAANVFMFFNKNSDSDGTPRHRPHLDLHQAVSAAGEFGQVVTDAGRTLPKWAGELFTCDCVVHRAMPAESVLLDYGRATRSVPNVLFRAVAARDGGCRAPSCTRKKAWCDAHHITWWRKHGETKLDNLLLLCAHHHRLVHRDGWQVQLDADGTAVFTLPDGRTLSSSPRGHPRQRAA